MKKQLSILAITALAVSGFAVSQANADSVTYGPVSTGTLTTDFSNVPLQLQLFDSNLGMLTGVSITISGDINVLAGSSVTNTAATEQSFTFTENVDYSLSDSGLLNTQLQTITTNPGHSQDYDLQPNASGAFGPYTGTTNGTFTFAPLTAFQTSGVGYDSVNVATNTTQTVSGGGGNITAALNTSGGAKLTVTYTYQAVPEPSTVALALLGGCGMIFLLRRRRSSVA